MRNCSNCGSGLSPHEHVGHVPGGGFLCEVCLGESYWKHMLKAWKSALAVLAVCVAVYLLFRLDAL